MKHSFYNQVNLRIRKHPPGKTYSGDPCVHSGLMLRRVVVPCMLSQSGDSLIGELHKVGPCSPAVTAVIGGHGGEGSFG